MTWPIVLEIVLTTLNAGLMVLNYRRGSYKSAMASAWAFGFVAFALFAQWIKA